MVGAGGPLAVALPPGCRRILVTRKTIDCPPCTDYDDRKYSHTIGVRNACVYAAQCFLLDDDGGFSRVADGRRFCCSYALCQGYGMAQWQHCTTFLSCLPRRSGADETRLPCQYQCPGLQRDDPV